MDFDKPSFFNGSCFLIKKVSCVTQVREREIYLPMLVIVAYADKIGIFSFYPDHTA